MAKNQEPRNGRTEVEVEIRPLELLSTLARLDVEAALAYDAAARLSEDREIARQLGVFARDHRRHVDELNRILEARGEPAVAPPTEGTPLLAALMNLAAPLGEDVVVVALLGNEQLTNLGYDAALAYEWEDELEALLGRFQADEERHLAWLAERHDAAGLPAREGDRPPLLE